MDDCISRQAALDCFHDWIDKHGDVHTADEMPEYRAIENLPPAQPNLQPTCNQLATDCISRQAAIDALEKHEKSKGHNYSLFVDVVSECEEIIRNLPSVQPDNKVNLCDSCKCLFPECGTSENDVIYGNGTGNDNICACAKYKPLTEKPQARIPDIAEKP